MTKVYEAAEGAPRRYLTAKRREPIGYMELDYHLRQPLDPRNSERMAREESWYVTLLEANGHAAVHRVPLNNRQWLDNETDAGDDIPGYPVGQVTDGADWLAQATLRRIGRPERSEDASFLVVENMTLDEPWRWLNLEALVLVRVLTRLAGPATLFAVAEPVSRRSDSFVAEPWQRRVFHSLGFAPFGRGTWISDLRTLSDCHAKLNKHFGLSDTQSRWGPPPFGPFSEGRTV